MNLLDFKGHVDRRFVHIQEELPAQVKREIKAIEIREQQLTNDVHMKLAAFQEAAIKAREHSKIQHGDLQEAIQRLEMKATEYEYKLITC